MAQRLVTPPEIKRRGRYLFRNANPPSLLRSMGIYPEAASAATDAYPALAADRQRQNRGRVAKITIGDDRHPGQCGNIFDYRRHLLPVNAGVPGITADDDST